MQDNLSNSHYQPENILLIQPFDGRKNDKVLLHLIPFLKDQYSLSDLRNVDQRYFSYLRMLRAKELQETQQKEESVKKEISNEGIASEGKDSPLNSALTKETDTVGEKNSDDTPDSFIVRKLKSLNISVKP